MHVNETGGCGCGCEALNDLDDEDPTAEEQAARGLNIYPTKPTKDTK